MQGHSTDLYVLAQQLVVVLHVPERLLHAVRCVLGRLLQLQSHALQLPGCLVLDLEATMPALFVGTRQAWMAEVDCGVG